MLIIKSIPLLNKYKQEELKETIQCDGKYVKLSLREHKSEKYLEDHEEMVKKIEHLA